MANKKESQQPADTLARLEQRIAALKTKLRAHQDPRPGDPALRALRKKLRRAQRRRRSLIAFAKAIEARHAGRKRSAAAPTAAPPAPSTAAPAVAPAASSAAAPAAPSAASPAALTG